MSLTFSTRPLSNPSLSGDAEEGSDRGRGGGNKKSFAFSPPLRRSSKAHLSPTSVSLYGRERTTFIWQRNRLGGEGPSGAVELRGANRIEAKMEKGADRKPLTFSAAAQFAIFLLYG